MLEKLIFIIVMVIALYLSINVIQNFSIKFDLLSQIIDEFQMGYIEDIKPANKTNNNNCPKSYEPLFSNFFWPGTYQGCGCFKGNSYEFSLGNCPKISNCFQVEETFQRKMDVWRGEKICVKRSQKNYINYNITFWEKEGFFPCSNTTHKNCGEIDGNGNYLCVKRGENCPINNIKFVNLKDFFDKEKLNDIGKNPLEINGSFIKTHEINENEVFLKDFKDYNKLELSENYLILFKREEFLEVNKEKTIQIPIKFSSEIVRPCISDMKRPSSSLIFPLMKLKYLFKCDILPDKSLFIDNKTKLYDSYNLQEFFQQNNYLKQIKEISAPFSLDYDKSKIELYARNYIGWKFHCMKNSASSLKNFLQVEENLNSILIANILHSFLSIGAIIFMGISACFLSKYFENLFKFMNLSFCAFNLFFPIQILSQTNWIINSITDEEGNFCGDENLNVLLKEISDSCLDLQSSYIWILLITICYTFVFIYVLYKWIKPFHNEYQNNIKNYVNMK